MIHLDNDAAVFVRGQIAEKALALRADANKARTHAAQRRGEVRRLFDFIAESFEESAIVLEKRLASVNPNKEKPL